MLLKKYLIVFLLSLIGLAVHAQKVYTISGEYNYFAPENISLSEAKRIASERARIEALATTFGTVIFQDNRTLIKNSNEKSTIDFLSMSGSDIKGEWLGDTKEPAYTIRYEQEQLVVTASVSGNAREIVKAGVDFSALILRNGTTAKFESDRFKNNDDVYLLFQSPVKGYLAVYLLDESGNAYCLLPYKGDKDGKTEITPNKEHLFFNSRYVAVKDAYLIDEYILNCNKENEVNYFYIIFSPNEFTKANDISSKNNLPRELNFSDFQKWLTDNRNKDKAMQVTIKSVVISR